MTSPDDALIPRLRDRPGIAPHFAKALSLTRFLALCCGVLLLGCGGPITDVAQLSGHTMGTTWSVRYVATAATPAVLRNAIEQRLTAIDQMMSTWRADSELSRFNTAPAGTQVTLSPELSFVTAAAIELARDTDGAYDPTVGPLVDLWGFGPEPARTSAPEPTAIEAARDAVGWQRITFDAATRIATQPGAVRLDLSSIAKGHAVDEVGTVLRQQGVFDFIIDIGGEVLAQGGKPDGTRWRVAIERPAPGERGVYTIIEPGDRAVATSGTYRNAFRAGEREYSHLIDPRTGYPITHDLVSVSVVTDSCMQADALATALSVLGPDAARAYAESRGLAVLLLRRDGDALASYETPQFRALRD